MTAGVVFVVLEEECYRQGFLARNYCSYCLSVVAAGVVFVVLGEECYRQGFLARN